MIKPQVRNAISLWYRNGLDILEDIDGAGWKLPIEDFAGLFTYHFRFDRIIFSVRKTANNIRRYVDCATFFEDAGIEIFLRPATIDYLKKIRFSKEDYMLRWMDLRVNMFLEELIQVLAHELLHREQWNLGMRDDPKNADYSHEWEYLADATEIQCYAQDTARCILYSKSKTWINFNVNLYRQAFGNDSIEFKRFMKWVHKFLEMMKQGQTGLLP